MSKFIGADEAALTSNTDKRIETAIVYAHGTGFDEGYECWYDEGFRDGIRVTKTAYEEGRDEALRALQG